MVSIDEFAPGAKLRPRDFDANGVIERRDVEPVGRLTAMEREVLRDILMATAGFVLIIAAIVLGLSV